MMKIEQTDFLAYEAINFYIQDLYFADEILLIALDIFKFLLLVLYFKKGNVMFFLFDKIKMTQIQLQ